LPADITNIKGNILTYFMPNSQEQVWLKMLKNNSVELRQKAIIWRRENAITRIDKPSRITRARRLGYKAK